jgi:hypothetical protein
MAFGAMAVALTTSGWKRWLFWIFTAVFAALSLVYANALPHFGLPLAAINRVVSALLAPLILGGVAMMLREKRGSGSTDFTQSEEVPEGPPVPRFATAPSTKWKPDITLRQAVYYLGALSTWKNEWGPNNLKNSTAELTSALASNKVTAWGREHPGEGDLYQIRQPFWNSTEVTLENDYVFSSRDELGVYDVHLCQEQMTQVWPLKEPPEASA